MTCKIRFSHNGRTECERSLIGCVRCCASREDSEAFKMAQLAAKPIYERRLDVTDAVRVAYDGREISAKQKAETKKKRRVRNISEGA